MVEEERVRVTRDFTRCRYIGELYLEMRTKMEWDEDCGESVDKIYTIFMEAQQRGILTVRMEYAGKTGKENCECE